MPKVPKSTLTAEAPAGIPEIPSIKFTAQDFGATQAETLSVAGRALGKVAEVLRRSQERRDVSDVLDVERTLIEGLNTRQPEYLLRKKKDAAGVTERAKKDWEKDYSKAVLGLSAKQKQLLEQRTSRQWLRHHGVVSGHEVREGSNAAIGSNEAAQEAATGFAAVNAGNTVVVSEQRNAIVRLSMAQSEIRGESEVEAEVREKNALLKFHTQVIQALARLDPAAVAVYYRGDKDFQGYRDDIPGDSRDDIEKIIFAATSTAKAQIIGDEAISRFDSVDAALAAMRKKTKPGAQRVVNKAEIKARFAEAEAKEAREQSDLLDRSIKIIKDKGRRSAVPPDDIARMNGRTLAAFDAFVENPNGPKRNSWNQYAKLLALSESDRAAFLKTDISMETEITEVYRNKLLALQTKIRTGVSSTAYLNNEKIDSMLKTVYQQLKLGDTATADKIRGDLSEYVERARDYHEKVLKQNLTSSELRTILYEAIVSKDDMFWFTGDTFAFELSEEDIATFEPDEISSKVERELAADIYISLGYVLESGKYINPNTKAPAPELPKEAILKRFRERLLARRRAFFAR